MTSDGQYNHYHYLLNIWTCAQTTNVTNVSFHYLLYSGITLAQSSSSMLLQKESAGILESMKVCELYVM